MKTIKTLMTLVIALIGMASCETEMPTPGDEPSPQFSAVTQETIEFAEPNFNDVALTVINGSPIIHEGSILFYKTSEGRFGKMEITHYNFEDNHKMSFTFVTFEEDGSVYKSNYNAGVRGTWTYDLDNDVEGGQSLLRDFHYQRVDGNVTKITPKNGTLLYIHQAGTPE